jgi:hypothetical protein
VDAEKLVIDNSHGSVQMRSYQIAGVIVAETFGECKYAERGSAITHRSSTTEHNKTTKN